MPIPLLGTRQADAALDADLRCHSAALWELRASDELLTALNPGLTAAYRGRSVSTTVYDSEGASLSLAAAEPAWSAEDWNSDGVREELLLLLGTQEALRYYDATSGRIALDVGAMTLRLDWIELGNATSADAPYWSLTTDAIGGRRLEVVGDGAGSVVLRHTDGTNTRTSAVGVSPNDRCSLRGTLYADGSVQLALVRNGGAETSAARSAALALTPWGAGGAVLLRLNERGNASRGTMAFRYGALYGGVRSRAQLLERR